MRQFRAHAFFHDIENLIITRNAYFQDNRGPVSEIGLKFLSQLLGRIRVVCEEVGFRDVVGEIDNLQRRLRISGKQLSHQQVTSDIDAIRRRIRASLLDNAFFRLTNDKAAYNSGAIAESYTETTDPVPPQWTSLPIPEKVASAFPSAIPELISARDCFSTASNTACAFHLMRAIEHALRATAIAVGITNPRVPLEEQVWQSIIEQIESRVGSAGMDKWPKTERSNAKAFWSVVIADFYAFKDGVRNILMHTKSGGTYSEEQALHLMNRTINCMGLLSEHVSEAAPRSVLVASEFK